MIYLIRHGQSLNNMGHVIAGRRDVPLSDFGKQQCENLKKLLDKVDFDQVYCSSLTRAKESAEIIFSGREIVPKICENVMEIDFGDWQGLTFAQVEEQFPDEFAIWSKDWTKFSVPNGEKFEDAKKRCQDFFDMLKAKHAEDNVAVVAHQGILRLLLSLIMDIFDIEIRIRNAGVVVINFERGKPQIVFTNDFDER